MQSQSSEKIAQLLRSGCLAATSEFGHFWIMANKTSEEWRLGALALGLLAILFALATVATLMGLVFGLVSAGVTNNIGPLLAALLRWYAFRKALAFLIGSAIAVGGFALASPYDPKWSIVPTLLGFIVIQSPGLWERLKHQAWFARLFRSGREPRMEFAQMYHLKKFAKPFRTTFRSGAGYCSDGLFIGTSTRESA
ncbi:hypothetical protein [Crateriforma conspicua]|uniref:Uncharacterized protein n=1 Tax=Crateriforma conspicua TaxID=2527996 RepID=A0A5C6FDM7_9PLAN|nr:hypothetical protein [Crateriforma conspicua]TWU59593.1 hypothetical protein V7x_55030 [Crateriforma conspicua]